LGWGILNSKNMMLLAATLIYLLGCFISYKIVTQQLFYSLNKPQRNFAVAIGTLLSWIAVILFMIDFYINTND
jgi:hypothetical protein